MSVTIEIPATPPSLNTWLSGHWRVRERTKATWQREITFRCRAAGLRRCERIEATAVFRFPDRRRRDTGNFAATLEKCLGDALQPDFIPDDDAKRFYMRDARIDTEVGPRRTLIELEGT